jgi:hypothetical protein
MTNPRKNRVSRRQFNQAAVAAGAAAATTFAAPAFLRGQNLNSKMNVASIGTGGRGAADMNAVGATENIVAICDVNALSLKSAKFNYPNAKVFTDFREMFDKASNDFDAVTIATCEHTHALATMRALDAKKHVYCEKPLTHDVWEARLIREAAAKAKVTTQMGIQIHATDNYRTVVEIIRSGAIGDVHEAHVCVSRAWGLQSEEKAKKYRDIVFVTERPKEEVAPPDTLNWDLWLGPAPVRPFNPVYFPGPKWYRWWDFGNGTMSDLGSHFNDLPFWALELNYPQTIEAFSETKPHPEIAPASMSAVYQYGERQSADPARGKLPPVKVSWHQGEDKPEIWKTLPKGWNDGHLFIGSKGMLLSNYSKYLLLPREDFKDFKAPAPTLPRIPKQNHHMEWIEACKAGKQSSANFEYSGLLTEANHLGNVAYRVGKKLEWDFKAMRCPNAPEADQYLKYPRRKGWELAPSAISRAE